MYAVSDEVALVGPGGGACAARSGKLVEDVADVAGHGFFADEQLFRDVSIRLAGRDQAEHLRLALAERADRLTLGGSGLLGDAREAGVGVELLEQLSCCVELETAAVLIASRFTDRRHEHAGLS